MPGDTKRGERGFTLIELLIVVAIIGILAAIAIPNLLAAMQRAKQKRTMADIRSVATAWETYAIDANGYTAAGVAVPEEERPPSGPEDGGVLDYEEITARLSPDYMKKVPELDGWGNPYVFLVVDSGKSYVILSKGKDGTIDEQQWELGETTSDFNSDIIYWNGTFIKYPEGAQGTGTSDPEEPARDVS